MRAAIVVVLVILGGLAAGAGGVRLLQPASVPDRQLAVEQRLMCPQCRETRLDTCDRAICNDMKSDIAARLRAGESEDSIVRSYATVYGPSVTAQQPGPPLAASVPLFVLAALLGVVAVVVGRRGVKAPA